MPLNTAEARRLQKRQDYRRHREKRIATIRAWGKRNPEKVAEYSRRYARKLWKERRAWYCALKARPCLDCKDTFPPECMDFDHVRGRKLFTIASGLMTKNMAQLELEVKKCEVVCANCHRIRTTKRGQS